MTTTPQADLERAETRLREMQATIDRLRNILTGIALDTIRDPIAAARKELGMRELTQPETAEEFDNL
jgi:hypothetical protein